MLNSKLHYILNVSHQCPSWRDGLKQRRSKKGAAKQVRTPLIL